MPGAGELVPYNTAEQMAAEYREAVAAIRAHAAGLHDACDRLQAAFHSADKYDRFHFCIGLQYGHGASAHHAQAIDKIIEQMKLAAWGCIIEKLNIRRLMSSQRIRDLDEALGRSCTGRYYGSGEKSPEFPEITPENIVSVANGFVMSATEFLEEAVREEYDFWRPCERSQYKTNRNFWKLDRKLIKGWMVEPGYSQNGKFRCGYSHQAHITALDNIFHMLDGKGPVQEYKGALATAIETSPDGRGETEYFKFKCYGNHNLHLEFKRKDLLDLFNQIAAKGDRLGREKRAG
jgi:hypothetical protein